MNRDDLSHPGSNVPDVTNGTFEGLIRSLDVDPHRRGKQFEKIVKWWLQNDPIHSRDVKKVWLWDEWPDRPGPDVGIDLVAELKDGSLVAVQAKCFDSERDIPKSELDSFISAASPRKYGRRMLVASTDGLSANARRMLHDNHVTQVMFSYLDSLQEFWPSTFLSLGGPRTISKWGPRTHQSLAIHDVTEGLRKASRGQLIMACGTGKTLTAMWIMESLDSHSTLVLVPSLSLLSQTLLEWSQHSNVSWSYLCVCSDDTVNKSDDAIISSVDDVPFPVTTKPSEIAHFLSQRGRKIIFSTYQSSAQVARGMKSVGKKFDLVICDEAHRLTGKNDAEFATALDDKKIPAEKRLFMTATPRTYTASVKSKASERGVEITSMDDEAMFGKELHKLSFGQAIEQELLTDYRVVIVGVTDPQVQELIERRELVTVGNVETDARTLAAHIGLAKATKDYDLKRTISFHGRIKAAQDFANNHASIVKWMPDNQRPSGTIWADTITGAMNSSERRKLLNRLKAEVPDQHALLSNARCLTEGVDVPSLDGVAFIDPRSSQVDIIQAVGRAIRKADDKNFGTIVLPVLIPHDAEVDHVLEDSAFKAIWAILNALKAHDEELSNQINQVMTNLAETDKVSDLPEKLVIDFPVDIESMLPDFVEKFEILLIHRTAETWSFWFGLLNRYVAETGSAHVNQTVSLDGKSLGSWVSKQRMDYRNGLLNQYKIQKLNDLPFWTWDPVLDRRQDLFNQLEIYVRTHGNAHVPSRHTQNGFALGDWVAKLRNDFKNGDISSVEVESLEKMPGWTWDPLDQSWKINFEELSNYLSLNGNKFPPYSLNSGNSGLAKWIIDQRARYKVHACSSDQIELLESLPGWSWNPVADRWEKSFQILQQYVDREGHSKVPVNYSVNDFTLGIWVSKQRVRYTQNRVPAAQIEKLESLPEWTWNPLEETWMSFYSEVQSIGVTNPLLGRGKTPKHLLDWMKDQRERRQQGLLQTDRISLLEKLPGWEWTPKANLWLSIYTEFKQWALDNDSSKVPSELLIAGANARSWVQNQRTRYRTQKLTSEQIGLLELIPSWTWQHRSDSWNRNYEQLKSTFESKEPVDPKGSSTLIEWIRTQRKAWRSGKLDPSKVVLLEQLPNWSWTSLNIAVSPDPTSKSISKAWINNYEVLTRYSRSFQTTIMHVDTNFEDIRIGKWVSRQRQNFKSGSLGQLQIQMLEQLPSWTWRIK